MAACLHAVHVIRQEKEIKLEEVVLVSGLS